MLQTVKSVIFASAFITLLILLSIFANKDNILKISVKLLHALIIVTLTLFIIFTHENMYSTGNVYALQMFNSKSLSIKIHNKSYVITTQNNGALHTRTYFFNLYQRQNVFYKRINHEVYVVSSNNMLPGKSSLWIFKNVAYPHVKDFNLNKKTKFFSQ